MAVKVTIFSELATQAIGIKRMLFYGGFHFDENGNCSISQNPNGPRYVGPLNDEIDRAWDALENCVISPPYITLRMPLWK